MSKISKKERRYIPCYDDPKEVALGVVEADAEKCNGCTLCVQICPASALELQNKVAQMRPRPHDECMFCGACQAICPADAIKMVSPLQIAGRYKVIDQGEHKPPRIDPSW